MIKVGITGGIGSGKTTFCREWEKLGAFVLYADDFAKQLMQEDEVLKNQIKGAFGEKSYDEQGNLNRAYLASEAFEKGRVEELNSLVHPVLWQRVDELEDEKEQEGIEVFAKEAAILLKEGRPENLDFVILILADEEQRIQRTLERDESSLDEVQDRISKQQNFESLTHLADYVILNNNSVESLRHKAQSTFKKIKQID